MKVRFEIPPSIHFGKVNIQNHYSTIINVATALNAQGVLSGVGPYYVQGYRASAISPFLAGVTLHTGGKDQFLQCNIDPTLQTTPHLIADDSTFVAQLPGPAKTELQHDIQQLEAAYDGRSPLADRVTNSVRQTINTFVAR